MKKFFVLLESTANTDEYQSIWEKIRPFLKEQQAFFQVFYIFPKNQPELNKLLTDRQSNETVITIGSSQLLIKVISTLANKKDPCPFCFIPTSETKKLAKKIGLALQPQIAIKQILAAFQPVYVGLAQIEEMNHQGHWLFSDQVSLGFNAYAANVSKNNLLNQPALQSPLKLYGHLTAVIDQEPFNTTLRLQRKYHFFKHTYAVQIYNQAKVSDQKLIPAKLPLKIEIITNLNFFNLLLLKIVQKLKFEEKLPFVHIFYGPAFQLTIDSLEFGEIDGQQQKNQFYDLYAHCIQFPFWFDPDSISLNEKNSQ